jgi:acetolactate synthase-1/2/3 large subunit
MPSCADVLARTLADAGVTRIFGLPGGEILDVLEAARRAGLEFLLTRHEATASLMADVTGQISGRPGVCAATLGPGAVNMTLGVANAFLDRSPLIAITAAHAAAAAPYATHQKLDLSAVYRPFTKLAFTLDGVDTAAKVRHAIDVSLAPRRGPVHIALPSDIARSEDRKGSSHLSATGGSPLCGGGVSDSVARIAEVANAARRPVAILGLDLDPRRDPRPVREFVEAFGLPTFVTPKAKGTFPEDHPLFCGVCAGVSGDAEILDFFHRADLLVGIGFEPVESDKLWHQTMNLVSIGPLSIAADDYRPRAEAVGDVPGTLAGLRQRVTSRFEWTPEDCTAFRRTLHGVLRPSSPPKGLSGYELTRMLRDLFPRETIFTTDVGSVKMITTQAWTTYEPLTFFESNGLSTMSYSLPAAMAARLQFPDRPILCTIGDGGFGMTLADLETCVRERLHFVTVVFNDSSLSLIDVAQQRRGHPTLGVRYGRVDFAAAAAGFGAWARRVDTMAQLVEAVEEARRADRPAVIDAVVDPAEYVAQTRAPRPEVNDRGRECGKWEA